MRCQLRDANKEVSLVQTLACKSRRRQSAQCKRRAVVLENRIVWTQGHDPNPQCLEQISLLLAHAIQFFLGTRRGFDLAFGFVLWLWSLIISRWAGDSLKDAPAGIQPAELRGIGKLRFRLSEKQNAAGFERVVQAVKDLFLQVGIEIDQEIPADEQ